MLCAVAHRASAAEDVIQFPLRRVTVKRATGLAGREFADFEIERMAAVGEVGVHHRAQGLGNLFAGAGELAGGRGPFHPGDAVEMHVLHAE
jgi:hypothetical protein